MFWAKPWLLLALGLTAAVNAQMNPRPRFSFVDRSEQLLASLPCDATGPGYSLLVVYRDEVLIDRSCGLAELESGEKIAHDSRFYAASIAKSFTAAAVLKLNESKQLKLSDRLVDYFPSYPAFAERIRIYHLLTHTSGLPDHSEALELSPVQMLDNDWVVEFVAGQQLLFEPGLDYSYSNSGYVLLAEIIEQVTGRSYSEFLTATFFEPLGLQHTVVFDERRPEIPKRARGYQTDNGQVSLGDYTGIVTTGSGAIFTTTHDLYRWYRALRDNRVLSPRSLALMFQAPPVMSGRAHFIAMGWFDETFGSSNAALAGMRAYGAIGMLRGYRAMVKFFPDEELAFVVLSNSGRLPVGGADIAGAFFERVR